MTADTKILRSFLFRLVTIAHDLGVESGAGQGWRPPPFHMDSTAYHIWRGHWSSLQHTLEDASIYLNATNNPPIRPHTTTTEEK